MILMTSLTWPESFLIIGLGWLAFFWWMVEKEFKP